MSIPASEVSLGGITLPAITMLFWLKFTHLLSTTCNPKRLDGVCVCVYKNQQTALIRILRSHDCPCHVPKENKAHTRRIHTLKSHHVPPQPCLRRKKPQSQKAKKAVINVNGNPNKQESRQPCC